MIKRFKKLERHLCQISTRAGWIDYSLVRSSRRRSLAISVEETGEVRVSVPTYLKENEVRRFIKEKAFWIVEKVKEAQESREYVKRRGFKHDQEFLFLGRKYRIMVSENGMKRPCIDFNEGGWSVQVPAGLSEDEKEHRVKGQLIKWYKIQAKEVLGGRVFHYSRIMGIEPLRIGIRTQKRIWGNCDKLAKKINLNWQIVMAPMQVIDYIVVHELAHLFICNHSRRFWQKVEKIIPDYAKRRKWLRDHSLDLRLPE